jgi:cardiolipin synthase
MFRAVGFVLTMLIRFFIGLLLSSLLRNQAFIIYNIIDMLSIIAVAYIVIKKNNPYSIAWIIVIFVLPVYGVFLYLFLGRSDILGNKHKKLRASMSRGAEFLYKDPAVYAELGDICPTRKRIAGY